MEQMTRLLADLARDDAALPLVDLETVVLTQPGTYGLLQASVECTHTDIFLRAADAQQLEYVDVRDDPGRVVRQLLVVAEKMFRVWERHLMGPQDRRVSLQSRHRLLARDTPVWSQKILAQTSDVRHP